MASQSTLQNFSATERQLQADPAIAFDPLNADHLNKRAEEALLRAAEVDVQGRHPYTAAIAATVANQLQRIRRKEPINQGVAGPVMADYYPESCRITSVDKLQLHNCIDRRQRQQVASHNEVFGRLSPGDLLSMIQERREDRHLQQLQPEKNNEPQSPKQVVTDQAGDNVVLNDESQDLHLHLHGTHNHPERPRSYAQIAHENHMALRHEHENDSLEAYQYFMMGQAFQIQCTQEREEYQAEIADLKQQVKTSTLVDSENEIMKAEYERKIEEKDKYISILEFQRNSALGTPSENGDILFEYISPASPNPEAGDNDKAGSVSDSGDSSFEIVNRAPPNSEDGDTYSMVTNAADSEREEAEDEEIVQEESVRCFVS